MRNPVAKHAHKFNRAGFLAPQRKDYNRKRKHKNKGWE